MWFVLWVPKTIFILLYCLTYVACHTVFDSWGSKWVSKHQHDQHHTLTSSSSSCLEEAAAMGKHYSRRDLFKRPWGLAVNHPLLQQPQLSNSSKAGLTWKAVLMGSDMVKSPTRLCCSVRRHDGPQDEDRTASDSPTLPQGVAGLHRASTRSWPRAWLWECLWGGEGLIAKG